MDFPNECVISGFCFRGSVYLFSEPYTSCECGRIVLNDHPEWCLFTVAKSKVFRVS
jgi:hypothetical protein